MSETPDGKILYKLKTIYRDGSTHILFDPLELVEKVVALIAPPRANLLRYSGVFASNSKIRSQIVPGQPKKKGEKSPDASKWAELLKRTFSFDVLQCDACGGKMRPIATIEDPAVIRAILNCVGVPSEPPRKAPPRAPPQQELTWSEPQDDYSQIDPTYDSF